MRNGYASPSSSPPSSPPSPLPISVGPDQHNYLFSSSPSLLSNSSAENLPLLREKTAFSLDHPRPHEPVSSPSCLRDLVEWLLLRCCNCCSWSLSEPRRITDIQTSSPATKSTLISQCTVVDSEEIDVFF